MLSVAIPVLAIWRLSDGGWHRLPFGSNLLGYALCLGLSYLALGPWGILPGIFYGIGLAQGYDGWDEYKVMLRRAWFAPLAAGSVLCLSYFGQIDTQNNLWLVGALLAPVIGNVTQPWLRARVTNRFVEPFEGACVGLSIAFLSLMV